MLFGNFAMLNVNLAMILDNCAMLLSNYALILTVFGYGFVLRQAPTAIAFLFLVSTSWKFFGSPSIKIPFQFDNFSKPSVLDLVSPSNAPHSIKKPSLWNSQTIPINIDAANHIHSLLTLSLLSTLHFGEEINGPFCLEYTSNLTLRFLLQF